MSAKENKEVQKGPVNDGQKINAPLSDTIENAHASGDGALERDKDTILPQKDKEPSGNNSQSGTEAY